MAFLILFLISALMVLATVGVKSFSDMMIQDANITDTIKPRGENLIK